MVTIRLQMVTKRLQRLQKGNKIESFRSYSPKIYKNTVCKADGIPVVLYEGQCHNRF